MDLKTISIMAKVMPMEVLVESLKDSCEEYLKIPIEERMKLESLPSKEQQDMLGSLGASSFMIINKIKFLGSKVEEITSRLDEMESIAKVAEKIVKPDLN